MRAEIKRKNNCIGSRLFNISALLIVLRPRAGKIRCKQGRFCCWCDDSRSSMYALVSAEHECEKQYACLRGSRAPNVNKTQPKSTGPRVRPPPQLFFSSFRFHFFSLSPIILYFSTCYVILRPSVWGPSFAWPIMNRQSRPTLHRYLQSRCFFFGPIISSVVALHTDFASPWPARLCRAASNLSLIVWPAMFATRYPFRSFLTSPFLTCSNSLATAPSSKQSTNAQWFIPVTIPCFPIPSLSWKPFLCPFFVLPAMNSRHCAYTLHCSSLLLLFTQKGRKNDTHVNTYTHTH